MRTACHRQARPMFCRPVSCSDTHASCFILLHRTKYRIGTIQPSDETLKQGRNRDNGS